MVVAKKFVVLSAFVGEPKPEDFIIVEEKLRALEKNEFLAEALYISVDPYQRVKLGNTFPCDMIGGQIARSARSWPWSAVLFLIGVLFLGTYGSLQELFLRKLVSYY